MAKKINIGGGMVAPRYTLKVTLALRQKAFVTLLFWLIYGLILIDS